MRKNKVASFVFLFLLCLGCTKEEFTVREYPLLESDTLVEVTPNGVKVGAKLVQRGNQTIEDYGVYWDSGPFLNRVYSDNISRSSNPNDTFMVEIKHGLTPGQEYYLWPYVRTKDFFVPGKAIKITSLGSMPPMVEDFYPKMGTWNDTLYIRGSHFSKRAFELKVNVGEISIGIIPKSDTLLSVRVPNKLNQSPCQVILVASGNKVTAPGTFSLKEAVISSIEPDTLQPGEILTLWGEGLHKLHSTVTIGGQKAEEYRGSGKSLVLKVPEGIQIGWNDLSVTTLGKTLTVKKAVCWDVALEKMVPDSVIPGQQVQLLGRGLTQELTQLFINGKEVSDFSENSNGLSFLAPSFMKNGWNQVLIKIGGQDLKIGKGIFSIFPDINSVKPLLIFCRDTIEIRGKTLMQEGGKVKVRIENSFPLKLCYQSDSLIKAIIPDGGIRIPGQVKVTAYAKTQVFSESLGWKMPVIENVKVDKASINNYVVISGKYLSNMYGDDTNVLFGGVSSQNVYGNPNEIRALIPEDCPMEASLRVDHQGSSETWDEKIHLEEVDEIACQKTAFYRGMEFEITGKNINNSGLKVYLRDSWGSASQCFVRKREDGKVTLKVKDDASLKDVQDIEVILGVQTKILKIQKTFLEPWSIRSLYEVGGQSGDYYTNMVTASFNGSLYCGLGRRRNYYENQKFWRIDIEKGEMRTIASYPLSKVNAADACVFNEHLFCSASVYPYVYLYRYDFVEDKWTLANEIMETQSYNTPIPFLYEVAGKGYLVHFKHVYEFNSNGEEISEVCQCSSRIVGGFKGNGKLFLLGEDRNMYRLDEINKKLEVVKQGVSSNNTFCKFVAEIDGKSYVWTNYILMAWDLNNLTPCCVLQDFYNREEQVAVGFQGKLWHIGGNSHNMDMGVFDPAIQEQIDQIKQQQQ